MSAFEYAGTIEFDDYFSTTRHEVYECQDCGALVRPNMEAKHSSFHDKIDEVDRLAIRPLAADPYKMHPQAFPPLKG